MRQTPPNGWQLLAAVSLGRSLGAAVFLGGHVAAEMNGSAVFRAAIAEHVSISVVSGQSFKSPARRNSSRACSAIRPERSRLTMVLIRSLIVRISSTVMAPTARQIALL